MPALYGRKVYGGGAYSAPDTYTETSSFLATAVLAVSSPNMLMHLDPMGFDITAMVSGTPELVYTIYDIHFSVRSDLSVGPLQLESYILPVSMYAVVTIDSVVYVGPAWSDAAYTTEWDPVPDAVPVWVDVPSGGVWNGELINAGGWTPVLHNNWRQ